MRVCEAMAARDHNKYSGLIYNDRKGSYQVLKQGPPGKQS